MGSDARFDKGAREANEDAGAETQLQLEVFLIVNKIKSLLCLLCREPESQQVSQVCMVRYPPAFLHQVMLWRPDQGDKSVRKDF